MNININTHFHKSNPKPKQRQPSRQLSTHQPSSPSPYSRQRQFNKNIGKSSIGQDPESQISSPTKNKANNNSKNNNQISLIKATSLLVRPTYIHSTQPKQSPSISPTKPHNNNNNKDLTLNSRQIKKAISMSQMGQKTFTKISQLVPKHLAIRTDKTLSLKHKNSQFKQSTSQRLQKQRSKFITPLHDVQLIMKKFDQISQDKKLIEQTPRNNLKLQKKSYSELDKKIKALLSLPTVKNIKQRVQKQRQKNMISITEPQTATLAIFAQASRRNLLNKYDQYIKKAIKPVHKKFRTQYQ